MHTHSNHLLTRACQFSCWAINKPLGPKILAVRTKSWLGHATVGTGLLIIRQLKQQLSVPSCFELFLNTLRLNAALKSSCLFVCKKISRPNKTQAVKLRKWSSKHKSIRKKEEGRNKSKRSGLCESKPVPGVAAGLWHKQLWFIYLN